MSRTVICLLLVLLFASFAAAQDSVPANIYAGGISYNVGGTPAVAGTGLYARKLADIGTYAFTVMDALPSTLRPLVVTTNVTAGISQRLATVAHIPIYVPTSAGVSFTGSNTGWAWTTGVLASVRVRDNWRIMPHVRLVKSSVSGGTGYQPVIGVLVGWGQ